MKNIWLWYSSLSDEIFIWKQKQVKEWIWVFTWDKEIYTNSFLHIAEQYFELWTSRVIVKWKKETMYIHIENTKEAKEKLIKSLQKGI